MLNVISINHNKFLEVISVEGPFQSSHDDPICLVEDRDGFLTRVPMSKLADWKKAQEVPAAPLTPAEEELKRRIVEQIYGRKE